MKSYTDDKCPQCGKDLFSSVPPWEAKRGEKIKVDTCLDHGKVIPAEVAAVPGIGCAV